VRETEINYARVLH